MSLLPADRCAFCHTGEENATTGELQRTPDGGIVAHYNCMRYSTNVISSEDRKEFHFDIESVQSEIQRGRKLRYSLRGSSEEDRKEFHFDIESVQSEIQRGRKLRCNFCKKPGATVACNVRSCRRTYHYPCVERAEGSPCEDEFVIYCFEHKHKETDYESFFNSEFQSIRRPPQSFFNSEFQSIRRPPQSFFNSEFESRSRRRAAFLRRQTCIPMLTPGFAEEAEERRRGTLEISPELKMPQMSETETKDKDIGCKLCDKLPWDSVAVITPTMTGSTYSLSMNSPGLFRCSESGIQFRVTQPVTIEYEVDSWSIYTEILQTLRGGYEIIGPLFNIKSSVEPNVVSAVYLPHCLCLGDFRGDKSLIRCFHYKDDNMVLETPSRMDPMYAVLENPTFSCIGVILYPLRLLKAEIMKVIPYHGMVLLFCNTIIREDLKHKYRLHLYLLPRIRTVEKKVEHFEMRFSFQRIHKPPQTKSVYSEKKYRIDAPLIARVLPKTLMFESHCPSEILPFTEISVKGKENTEVNLSIHSEDEEVTVWESVVSAEEMLAVPFSMSKVIIPQGDCKPLPEQSDHFVDKHRANLIRMISVVDLVLDDLLDLNLLTYEQYETVLSKNTNPEQMRKLYDYIRAWGNDDKDKVYQTLRKHNYPIIKKLENEVSLFCNEPHTTTRRFKCNIF